MTLRHVLISGILLGLFAVVGTTLVAVTEATTAERIAANQQAFLLRNLNQVLESVPYNNALIDDVQMLAADDLLGQFEATPAYRARWDSEARAVILQITAWDGYSGEIGLILGVDTQGQISAARVVKHTETPGLGDGIEKAKSDWIDQFIGRSLQNTPSDGWQVKRDGGEFDQMTGATITPRAVVAAIHRGLQYVQQHQATLFDTPTIDATP